MQHCVHLVDYSESFHLFKPISIVIILTHYLLKYLFELLTKSVIHRIIYSTQFIANIIISVILKIIAHCSKNHYIKKNVVISSLFSRITPTKINFTHLTENIKTQTVIAYQL